MSPASVRPSSRRRAFGASSAEQTRATYLYCIVRSAKQPNVGRAPAGLPGGKRPTALAAGRSLWLIVSQVPLERYGPARLETALRHLDWVAEVALAHEAVVEHFARMKALAVLPMKMFTMFSSSERAAAEMQARRKEIEEVLTRIAGCEEWGVRVTRGTKIAPRISHLNARSGTAFLAARRQVRDSARAAAQKASGAAAVVFQELSPFARDARQRHDAPPGALPPMLDAAFLVPGHRRAAFRGAARRAARACAAAGAEMILTGPWPAYNFVQTRGTRA